MRRSAVLALYKSKTDKNKSEGSSVRSTSSVLEIFKNSAATEEKNPVDSSPTKENSPKLANTNERIYNIVWGKKSTRKHKKWEGDGTLVVKARSAVLRDENGQVMGRLSNVATEGFVEGHILSIGGKEVQIIDMASESEKTEEKPIEQPVKKMKLNPTKQKSDFVLPPPPLEHQWQNGSGKPVTDVYVDDFLARTLRPHQKQGIAFLYECVMGYRLAGYNGAILADEMGLGKTLQCITLAWTLSKRGPYGGLPVVKTTLVVAPSGLLKNWIAELNRWLGRYRMHTYMVDSKNPVSKYVPTNQPSVILISYDMFVRNANQMSEVPFGLLICDEGHRLKNDATKLTKLLDAVDCKRRIVVTGTPVQNDLLEFYTLSNFVNKGVLGDLNDFRVRYVQPISSQDEDETIGKQRESELNRKIASFVLRRRANELPSGILPSKTELVVFCPPSDEQIERYVATVDTWRNSDSQSRPPHLTVISQLQRICAHPLLTKNNDIAQLDTKQSGKLTILMTLLTHVYGKNERIVVVSSRTRILDLIEHLCGRDGYKSTRLDGSTAPSVRQTLVDRFNDGRDGCFVFLLSSRAGGVGLNLIGASRLVLFDSDWNPATDLQAMARIWRDGQRKSVYIYRLLTAGTIEEKIFQRQITKTDLSNAIVDPDKKSSFRLSDDELKDLLNTDRIESDACGTHIALGCTCPCNGTVPERDEVVQRRCQLGNSGLLKSDQTTFMNQLMRWEHHACPFDSDMLDDCGLIECKMSFIFRNVSSSVC